MSPKKNYQFKHDELVYHLADNLELYFPTSDFHILEMSVLEVLQPCGLELDLDAIVEIGGQEARVIGEVKGCYNPRTVTKSVRQLYDRLQCIMQHDNREIQTMPWGFYILTNLDLLINYYIFHTLCDYNTHTLYNGEIKERDVL